MFKKSALLISMLLWSIPAFSMELTPQVDPASGFSYVSGGIGEDETDQLSAMSKDFSVKLVFASSNRGEWLADVQVRIEGGGKVFSTTSQGPWLLLKLPAGRYSIEATYNGSTKRGSFESGGSLRTEYMRW